MDKPGAPVRVWRRSLRRGVRHSLERGGQNGGPVDSRPVSNKKNIVSIVVLIGCVAITLATVMNVFGDNAEVEALAQKAACWDVKDCKYAKRAMVRTPLGQTFTYEGGGRTFDVTCRRAFIVLGDYTCKAEPQK